MDWLPLVQTILTPLAGSAMQLGSELIAGTKSLAVARAELAGILSVAVTRLDDMEREFVERDRLNDARVAALTAPKPPREDDKP